MIYTQALIKLWTIRVFNQPDSLKRSDAFSPNVHAAQLLMSQSEHVSCNTLSSFKFFLCHSLRYLSRSLSNVHSKFLNSLVI